MTTTNTYGRQVVVPLTNKSGGSVAAGDVVIIDTSNNDAFTTSTAGAVTGGVGVAQETIASNAIGRVLTSGYAALVNTSASVTRGNFGKTHTVVKQAVDAGASRVAGTFCQFLTAGTTPDAIVFSPDLGTGSGTGTVTTVKDEGSNLSTAVVSLDFVGGGVTATGTTAVSVAIPGGLIGVTSYQGSGGDTTYTTTSNGTFVDVDATNVKVTFTAPASGNVLIRVTIPGTVQTGGNGIFLNLRESTTNIGFQLISSAPAGTIIMATAVFYVTGISAGSHTYKLGWDQNAGTGTATIYYGSTTRGPIVMEAWAAP